MRSNFMQDRTSLQLIDHVCRVLQLDEGALYPAARGPSGALELDLWRTHGDWLLLAERMHAERVFFVGDDPVIVFAAVNADAPDDALVEAYRQAWSLSRPHCLFLARGGELRVYALSAPPTLDSDGRTSVTPIEIVERAADVQDALRRFHRDRIESGEAFDTAEFRSPRGRADHRLIADVNAATDALTDLGLDQATAHTLIERVILVRYLEDREIIVPAYLHTIASKRPEWAALLEEDEAVPNFGADSTFVRCLANADLAYSAFDQLAADFNGDLFIVEDAERTIVHAEHLQLIKALLEGTASARYEPLFLWAYDFGVVPTSLISTMYEVFYQRDVVSKLTGTHYTPAELVEFTLAQTLTTEVLSTRPTICDPACGSGIFLVEAFRMVVRYESGRLGRRLSADELKDILLSRIAGVDLNEEAVRLAAFSLYLAYLNYQTPQDIREAGPLPRLIRRFTGDKAVLVVSDAFAPTLSDQRRRLHQACRGRTGHSTSSSETHRGLNRLGATTVFLTTGESAGKLKVGDRNRSQLFLYRALDLVADDGVCAMLVAASAFVATRDTSRAFRRSWLPRVAVRLIVNFAQVRELFFSKAIAPFFLIVFTPRPEIDRRQRVIYETAVPSLAFERTRSMAFARLDRRVVEQRSLEEHDYLWKVYAWGGHRDEALLARLNVEDRLEAALPVGGAQPGYGYQLGPDEPSSGLKALPSLKKFAPWGALEPGDYEDPPVGTKRQPDERLYHGQRILVRRGVSGTFGPYARLVEESLSFRHQIYCLPMACAEPWQAQVLLGTILSSLGRYRLFMTSSAWGLWHDQVYKHEVLGLPVRLRLDHPATDRVVAAIDQLRDLPSEPAAGHFAALGADPSALRDTLAALDDAVFDLFELCDDERDIVMDFWARFTEPQARLRPPRSGVRHGLEPPQGSDLVSRYLQTFLRQWNGLLLSRGARLGWSVVHDPNVSVTAAIFTLVSLDDAPRNEQGSPSHWRDALQRFAMSSGTDARSGGRLYREGLLRAVSGEGIVIAKRDEARLWTPTSAREDAEATMLQATRLGAS